MDFYFLQDHVQAGTEASQIVDNNILKTFPPFSSDFTTSIAVETRWHNNNDHAGVNTNVYWWIKPDLWIGGGAGYNRDKLNKTDSGQFFVGIDKQIGPIELYAGFTCDPLTGVYNLQLFAGVGYTEPTLQPGEDTPPYDESGEPSCLYLPRKTSQENPQLLLHP